MSKRRHDKYYNSGELPQVGDIVELDPEGASAGMLSSPILSDSLDASMGYRFRVQNVVDSGSVSTTFLDGTPVCAFDDGHWPGIFRLVARGATQSSSRRLTVRAR